MKAQKTSAPPHARAAALLNALSTLAPAMQRRALQLDAGGEFPAADLMHLRELGALAAPVPTPLGGLGMGTEPEGALHLLQALRAIGRGSLSVGRIYEAHVNALRLTFRYGDASQARMAAADALAGHLFGLWVTDAPGAPLRLRPDYRLQGAKFPCSAAGQATRAVVTALTDGGESQLVLVRLVPGERSDLSEWNPHGMRATGSGRVTLDGLEAHAHCVIGADGDYLREPDFSAGAWRTSAVTLGGLEALSDHMRAQLLARGRAADPHQLNRVAAVLTAQETARLWITQAALLGESLGGEPDNVGNYVNLARLAAEAACLDAIRQVQQALGMPSFGRGTVSELLYRDLAMYLRQPAPDMARCEAAAHFMLRSVDPDGWSIPS